jgi:RNA polymerase sigma-70 factor (ECF subfamily)
VTRPLTSGLDGRSSSPANASDLAWLSFMRGGDITAFEELFRCLAAALTIFALTYVDTYDDAEECVQVVFCWLWDHRFTLPNPRSVRSYLFAAVRNRALNLVRDRRTEAAFREQVERASRQGAVAPASPAPDSELAARDIEHALRSALAQMPARCREVYTLRRDHGLRTDEVADALGISPKTVEIHMMRALGILRVRLAPWLDA